MVLKFINKNVISLGGYKKMNEEFILNHFAKTKVGIFTSDEYKAEVILVKFMIGIGMMLKDLKTVENINS
jgi:hypothetical protein